MGGLSAFHLRLLCDSWWEGGHGYSLRDVGDMTLDQICTMLCDRKILRAEPGERTTAMPAAQAASAVRPAPDGTIAGRAADGTPLRGRVRGKSKAREAMEAEDAKRAAERAKRQTRRGKGGR